jgi:hypothetical protein
MSDDEQEKSDIDFVPCVTWVRRGVAKPEPEKVKLTKEELREIIEQTKVCKFKRISRDFLRLNNIQGSMRYENK